MAQISSDELEQIFSFAIDLGKKAGSILLQATEKRMRNASYSTTYTEELNIAEKDNQVDIVTQTDEGKEILLERFHSF
jgi:myo-inositol-1(or 4)-monophosphatase